MRFWDSSALVALFVSQMASPDVRDLRRTDSEVLAWTMTDVEIHSAPARLAREGALLPAEVQDIQMRVASFWRSVHQVSLLEPVKVRARRLLGVHPLRAADSLQLGAALAGCFDEPLGVEFVCLDVRLSDAARREGFAVVP